ncbi:MAG: ABC transporter substrate-binding protein [bacterium]
MPIPARVISLLPAATEIVAALGAADLLVAISHECDYPSQVVQLPRVTASTVDRDATSADIDAAVRALFESGRPVFMLDAGDVVRLAPTVILTQTLCDVCAVSEGDVRDIAHLLSPAPMIVPLVATTLDGVWDDIRNVGAVIGRSTQADELLASLDERIRRVHETLKAARAPRPRVAVIEWLDPLFAAGHWTPELVRRAGGVDVLASAGDHSVRVAIDRVRDANPDVLIFAPCGFDVERSEREARALLGQDEWAWARGMPSWAIDGNALTSRAGPRLADAIEVMASIFAPSLFDAPPTRYARILSS